jgi:hypothetical protein
MAEGQQMPQGFGYQQMPNFQPQGFGYQPKAEGQQAPQGFGYQQMPNFQPQGFGYQPMAEGQQAPQGQQMPPMFSQLMNILGFFFKNSQNDYDYED